MIVGLSGYARSGKDESAKALIPMGYKRIAFADTMRTFLYELNPAVSTLHDMHTGKMEFTRVQQIIDHYGWDGYKESLWGDEIRGLMQRLGTDAGRNILGENVWVEAALRGHGFGDVVVTDVRFPNEAESIEDIHDGCLIRVTRPGVAPVNAHESETALDDWDFRYHVTNDGSIEDLHRKITEIVTQHAG